MQLQITWKRNLIHAIVCFLVFATAVQAQIQSESVAAARIKKRPGALLPPGVVGREQLRRHPENIGHIQPVEFRVPDSASVSIADGGGFSTPFQGRLTVGLTVGQVYRLKVGNIPNQIGAEVFPSVEVIGRLRPPVGQENRFPIPIQITERDLRSALQGKLVVRVIFLEDPQRAYPEQEDPREQRTIPALQDEDPLRLAEDLGRPMAILRLGSRVPDAVGSNEQFLFGSPSVVYLTTTQEPIAAPFSPFTSANDLDGNTDLSDTQRERELPATVDAEDDEVDFETIETSSDDLRKRDLLPASDDIPDPFQDEPVPSE